MVCVRAQCLSRSSCTYFRLGLVPLISGRCLSRSSSTYFHGMGDVRLQPDAIRIMQRARNILAVDDGHFQRFFETFLGSIHR
jgi:hypothetical protein